MHKNMEVRIEVKTYYYQFLKLLHLISLPQNQLVFLQQKNISIDFMFSHVKVYNVYHKGQY